MSCPEDACPKRFSWFSIGFQRCKSVQILWNLKSAEKRIFSCKFWFRYSRERALEGLRGPRGPRGPRRHGLLAVGGQRGDERRARAPRKHLRAAHLLNTVYQVRQIRLALTIKFRKERDRSNILRETTGSHMRRKLLDHLACYQAGERRSTSSKAGMGAAPVSSWTSTHHSMLRPCDRA